MRRLTILNGLAKGAVYGLTGAQVEIGRADENTIVFEDTDVSRRHAVLTRDGSEYKVRDLGTMNGTWVNGQQIKEARLKPNDVLQFGLIQTRYEPAPASAAAPVGPPRPVVVVRKSEVEQQLDGLTLLNRELNLQLLNARQELNRAQQEKGGSDTAEVERLQRELTAAKDDVERARESVARVEELSRRNDALTAQLTHKDREISRVKQEAEERLQRELQAVNDELARARGEVERVKHEAEERVRQELTERRRIESELTRAQGERELMARELAETKTRLQEVTRQLDEVRRDEGQSESAVAQRRALEQEIAILRRQAESDRQELAARHARELGQLRTELTAAQAEIEMQAKKETAKITVIAAAKGADQAELSRVRAELEQTRTQLEAARQQAERVQALMTENQDLAKRLTETQRDIAELRQRQPVASDAEEVRKLKGELSMARAELFRLGTKSAPRAAPAAAAATPATPRPPTKPAPDSESPFEVGPPPGRLQKFLVGLGVCAVLAGLLWQLFRGEPAPVTPPPREPLVDHRVILDEPPVLPTPPTVAEPPAPEPTLPPPAPVEPAPVTAPVPKPAEPSPAPAAPPSTEPSLPAPVREAYRDPNGRFVCTPPAGWRAEPESTSAQSRVRFVSGKDEIVVLVHGSDWPALRVKDQAQLTESMIAQFRLRHPSAYAEPEATEWQMMNGGLALQMDLSVSENGERLWVRMLEYRQHGRSTTMELVVRTMPQKELLAIIFDAFLVNFEILPVE